MRASDKRALKIYNLFGITIAPFASAGYSLQRWFFPCNSATFGYFLLSECKNGGTSKAEWGYPSMLILFIICLVSGWLVLDAFGVLVFHLICMSFVQAFYFSFFTKRFKAGLTSEKAADNNCRYGSLRMYKELQILNRYYNNLHQNGVIYVVLFLTMTSFITGAYSLVGFGSQMKLHEFLFFFTITFDALVWLLVLFSVLANVNSGAVEGILAVRNKLIPLVAEKRGRKWVELYWRSLSPLKVCIGEVNHVEKRTPFKLLDFSVAQIAGLLLLD